MQGIKVHSCYKRKIATPKSLHTVHEGGGHSCYCTPCHWIIVFFLIEILQLSEHISGRLKDKEFIKLGVCTASVSLIKSFTVPEGKGPASNDFQPHPQLSTQQPELPVPRMLLIEVEKTHS